MKQVHQIAPGGQVPSAASRGEQSGSGDCAHAAEPPPYSDRVKCSSCANGSGPHGCTDCLNTGIDPSATAGGIEAMLNDAYAEGRKDEAEEHAWRPIETAPEDENVLVATTGGWVDTAFWTDDGDGPKWWWLVSANNYAKHPLHPNLVPTHWMPLPKHPYGARSPGSLAEVKAALSPEDRAQVERRSRQHLEAIDGVREVPRG